MAANPGPLPNIESAITKVQSKIQKAKDHKAATEHSLFIVMNVIDFEIQATKSKLNGQEVDDYEKEILSKVVETGVTMANSAERALNRALSGYDEHIQTLQQELENLRGQLMG